MQWSEGLHSMGYPKWQLVICLLIVYVMLYLSLFKGVKSSGKSQIFKFFKIVDRVYDNKMIFYRFGSVGNGYHALCCTYNTFNKRINASWSTIGNFLLS